MRRKETPENILLAKYYAPGNKKFKDKPDAKWKKGHGGNLRTRSPHTKLSFQLVKKIKRKAKAMKRLINQNLNANVIEVGAKFQPQQPAELGGFGHAHMAILQPLQRHKEFV